MKHHKPRDVKCRCVECQNHRLAYVLWEAVRCGEITYEDYGAGIKILADHTLGEKSETYSRVTPDTTV